MASPLRHPDHGPPLLQWVIFISIQQKHFEAAFGPHAQEIMADIPNYTDIQPTIQLSEVKV